MKYLSLFSGASGGDLGLQQLLGWKCLGYIEYEAYCQKVLKQRIKDGVLDAAPIFGDIKKFISEGFAKCFAGMVDAISAGFPCQPFSVAGQQKGEADERNMWLATRDAIRIIRPGTAFMENVPGLSTPERFALYRTLDEGRVYRIEEWEEIRETIETQITLPSYFGRILGDLAEIGYDAKWCVLGADDVGAPHRRKRLWIAAADPNCKRGGIQSKPGEFKNPSDTDHDGKKKFMANSKRMRQHPQYRGKPQKENGGAQEGADRHVKIGGSSPLPGDVANSDKTGLEGWQCESSQQTEKRTIKRQGGGCTWWDKDPADLPNTKNTNRWRPGTAQIERRRIKKAGGPSGSEGTIKSGLGRVAHGVAHRVDRLKAIGNG